MLAIPLSFLKVSNLYAILCGFYGYLNEQSWMCELCMFSQILSHVYTEPNYHYSYSSDVLHFTTVIQEKLTITKSFQWCDTTKIKCTTDFTIELIQN